MTIKEALAKVDAITDALGKPIDENVRQIVAALHLHGIPTTGSCEGHVDWGEPYPWIDIGADVGLPAYGDTVKDDGIMRVAAELQKLVVEHGDLELYATAIKVRSEVRYGINVSKKELQLRALDENIDEGNIQQENYGYAAKLTKLLQDFYKFNRAADYSHTLVLVPGSLYGNVRLLNSGSAASYKLSTRQKYATIRDFQVTLNNFAEFLITQKP